MLAPVTVHHHQGATQRGLAIEHFLRLVLIRIAQGENGGAEMSKRLFQREQDPGFVTR